MGQKKETFMTGHYSKTEHQYILLTSESESFD
ncbi:GNAT family N-acetyltransferase, partial [Bacillus sp. S10C12M]|nr:GNAT family N-acetyltransferase [Bacillus sp. S10C12M]